MLVTTLVVGLVPAGHSATSAEGSGFPSGLCLLAGSASFGRVTSLSLAYSLILPSTPSLTPLVWSRVTDVHSLMVCGIVSTEGHAGFEVEGSDVHDMYYKFWTDNQMGE